MKEVRILSNWNLSYLEEGKLRWLDAKGHCMILSESGIVSTAQGNPAEFSDGSENYVKSCVCDIVPIQDLHGYDAPWVGGSRKNKLDTSDMSTSTQSGVSFVRNSDGSVTTSGTSTADFQRTLFSGTLPSGSYILTGGIDSSIRLRIAEGGTLIGHDSGSGVSFTLTEDTVITVNERFANDIDASATIYPMIRLSAESDTYEPYANICPISGHTSVTLNVADDDTTPTVSTDYTAALPSTVYGGSVDLVSGEGMETMANIESYNGEVINEPWLSSMDEYVPGNTPTTGAQVVYTLTDPIPFITEGQEILSLYGNNVFSCMDDVTVIYLADTKKYIDNAVNP